MNKEILWQNFLADGSVYSYLRYKSIENLKDNAQNDNKSVYNRGTGYQGTTNRGKGQTDYRFN